MLQKSDKLIAIINKVKVLETKDTDTKEILNKLNLLVTVK